MDNSGLCAQRITIDLPSMERSKFKHRQSRKAKFHDRDSAITAIEDHLAHYKADAAYFRVVSVLGIGGVGKTRLLEHIEDRSRGTEPPLKIVRVSLEAEATTSVVGPLKAIRDQVGMQCLLFDCAVIEYWTATGQPIQATPGGAFAESIIFKGLEASASVVGFGLPLSFAADAFKRIQRQSARSRFYKQEEFAEIDGMRGRPADLLERLPYFLGLDIERRLKSTSTRLAFFYDAYEKQSRRTLAGKAAWLREFIGSLDKSVHLIASRESLGWPAEWRDVSDELVIGALPKSDALALVRSELPDASEAVVRKVVSMARGVPFFLEAGLDAYEALSVLATPVLPQSLPASHEQSLLRLLDHLEDDSRSIVLALSLLQFFDETVFHALAREFNVSLASFQFADLTSLFFIERANRQKRIYKIHNVVAGFVESEIGLQELRARAARGVSQVTALKISAGADGDMALMFLKSLLKLMGTIETDHHTVEAVMEIGYRLYDLGYWRELATISADHPNKKGDGGLIASFFAAICQRRLTGIEAAKKALEKVLPRASRLGRFDASVNLERAYLHELSGNYREASATFQTLLREIGRFDPSSRAHVRTRLFHGDMLIIAGQFRDGAAVLLETAEALDDGARLDWAEFTRHRAHAHRFSHLYSDAEALYLRALAAAEDSPSLAAKLRTNLAETRCWSDPLLAQEDGEIALELNARIGNQIEIGKAHVALANCSMAIDRNGEALTHLRQARSVFEKVGYRAGLLFVDVADAALALSEGQPDRLGHALSSGLARAETLGVYAHLMTPFSLAAGKLDPSELVGRTQWLEEADIATRMERVISAIKRRDA